MSNAAKVAEIFINAGMAFSKLGEMTMELQKDEAKSCGSGKWTEEEIQLLKDSVYRFGQDIEKISQMVRSRTAKQIKEAMKRRNLLGINTSNDNKLTSPDNTLNQTFEANISNEDPIKKNELKKLSDEIDLNKICKERKISNEHQIEMVDDITSLSNPNTKEILFGFNEDFNNQAISNTKNDTSLYLNSLSEKTIANQDDHIFDEYEIVNKKDGESK